VSDLDAATADDANPANLDASQPLDSSPPTDGFVPGDAGDAATNDAGDAAVPTPAPDYLWYVLDETSGTTARDSSSHHFDITNLTGVTWAQGANFDGTSGGGYTTVDSEYRAPPISITVWLTPTARADETSTQGTLYPFPPNALSDDIPGVGGYGVGLNVWTDGTPGSDLAAEGVDTCTQGGLCVANGNQTDAGPACTSETSCNAGFVAGHEYFVAITIAPASADAAALLSAQVYVNGALFDQTTAYTPPASPNPTLYLGCHNLDTAYLTKRIFDGRIRDVRVYKRQLASTEVAQLYANGPTTVAPPPIDAGPADADADAN
jgi:hypothetical protein